MKVKIFFIFITFLCLVLSGCNNSKSEEVKWFDSESNAIQNGLKKEGISEEDIISNYDINGELFLIYKKEDNDQLLVGLANIANKDDKYRWYRNDSYVNVKKNTNISLITKDLSGNEFTFYTGIAEEKEITVKTNLGDINPFVDENTGIYYFLISNN